MLESELQRSPSLELQPETSLQQPEIVSAQSESTVNQTSGLSWGVHGTVETRNPRAVQLEQGAKEHGYTKDER